MLNTRLCSQVSITNMAQELEANKIVAVASLPNNTGKIITHFGKLMDGTDSGSRHIYHPHCFWELHRAGMPSIFNQFSSNPKF